jgi:hypothetical protein
MSQSSQIQWASESSLCCSKARLFGNGRSQRTQYAIGWSWSETRVARQGESMSNLYKRQEDTRGVRSLIVSHLVVGEGTTLLRTSGQLVISCTGPGIQAETHTPSHCQRPRGIGQVLYEAAVSRRFLQNPLLGATLPLPRWRLGCLAGKWEATGSPTAISTRTIFVAVVPR